MSKLISGYLWAWTEWERKEIYANFKKFYPDADLFINVDYDGDVENYTKVGEEIGAMLREIIFK